MSRSRQYLCALAFALMLSTTATTVASAQTQPPNATPPPPAPTAVTQTQTQPQTQVVAPARQVPPVLPATGDLPLAPTTTWAVLGLLLVAGGIGLRGMARRRYPRGTSD